LGVQVAFRSSSLFTGDIGLDRALAAEKTRIKNEIADCEKREEEIVRRLLAIRNDSVCRRADARPEIVLGVVVDLASVRAA
jgi:hypothetical protein